MNDRMKLLDDLKERIMLHGNIEDENVAMDIARKWAKG